MGNAKRIERRSPPTAVEMDPAPFAHVPRGRLAVKRLFHSGWIIPGTIVLKYLVWSLGMLFIGR